jgi:hypothetical protein
VPSSRELRFNNGLLNKGVGQPAPLFFLVRLVVRSDGIHGRDVVIRFRALCNAVPNSVLSSLRRVGRISANPARRQMPKVRWIDECGRDGSWRGTSAEIRTAEENRARGCCRFLITRYLSLLPERQARLSVALDRVAEESLSEGLSSQRVKFGRSVEHLSSRQTFFPSIGSYALTKRT